MKLPKKVLVKDETYDIIVVDKIPGEDHKTYGICDDDDKIIYIRRKQTPKGTLRTFSHELLHAMEYEYKFKLSHKLIEKIEVAFVDILIDNGWISFKW